MNISHLKAFLEIAATGSFLKSAERLHITQSTISARIKTLEEQLGQPLFIRKRDGALLTPQGHQLIHHAKTAVQAWAQAKQQLSLPDQLESILSIGVQTDLWDTLLLPWLDDLKEEHPDVGLALRVEYSETLLEEIHQGKLDLAITYLPSSFPGFISDALYSDELILVSSHEREPTQEWRDDYVYVDWGRDFQRAHQKAYPGLRAPAVSVGSYRLAMDYIYRNQGSAFVPRRAIKDQLSNGIIYEVKGAPRFARDVYLVQSITPAQAQLNRMAIESLTNFLNDKT